MHAVPKVLIAFYKSMKNISELPLLMLKLTKCTA